MAWMLAQLYREIDGGALDMWLANDLVFSQLDRQTQIRTIQAQRSAGLT